MSLSIYLPFVNEQIEVQKKLAKKFEAESWRHKLHSDSRAKFEEMAKEIEKNDKYIESLKKTNSAKVSAKQQLSLSFDEIQDLPEELLSELSISEADKTEFIIQEIINDAGGIASLDRILVTLYKKTGEIVKRNHMTSRLYRMAQKDMIFSVPSKKGVYSTQKLSDSDAREILNLDNESSPAE